MRPVGSSITSVESSNQSIKKKWKSIQFQLSEQKSVARKLKLLLWSTLLPSSDSFCCGSYQFSQSTDKISLDRLDGFFCKGLDKKLSGRQSHDWLFELWMVFRLMLWGDKAVLFFFLFLIPGLTLSWTMCFRQIRAIKGPWTFHYIMLSLSLRASPLAKRRVRIVRVSMQVFLPQCHINSGGEYRRSREKAEVKREEGKLGGHAEAKQETRDRWKETKKTECRSLTLLKLKCW